MSQDNITPVSFDPKKASNPTLQYGALGAGIDASQRNSAAIDSAWQRSVAGDSFTPEQDGLRQSTMVTNLLRAYMRIAQGEQVNETQSALEARKGLKEIALG